MKQRKIISRLGELDKSVERKITWRMRKERILNLKALARFRRLIRR
jgi:hypothetical protein